MTIIRKKRFSAFPKTKKKEIIPRDNTPDSKIIAVCKRHWPKDNYETMQCYGKLRSRHPPSVFTCIKLSLLQTPTPPARLTEKTFAKIRNQYPDKINAFNNQDKILNFNPIGAGSRLY